MEEACVKYMDGNLLSSLAEKLSATELPSGIISIKNSYLEDFKIKQCR